MGMSDCSTLLISILIALIFSTLRVKVCGEKRTLLTQIFNQQRFFHALTFSHDFVFHCSMNYFIQVFFTYLLLTVRLFFFVLSIKRIKDVCFSEQNTLYFTSSRAYRFFFLLCIDSFELLLSHTFVYFVVLWIILYKCFLHIYVLSELRMSAFPNKTPCISLGKENGHKKAGTTGYNRARHIGEVVFEVVRGRQGLVSAVDPCNAPGSKSCLPLFF